MTPPSALSPAQLAATAWRFTPTGYGAHLGGLTHPRHILYLGQLLARVAAGEIDRLLVFMPPRHAKSETCSHWFPTWCLDLFPHWRILLASYEATFAAEWGWKVRQTIIQQRQHLRVQLAPDFKARNLWFTTAGGGMVCAGRGGGFTGRPGDVILIDDPFKNWQEAHSPTIRQAAWDWYRSTIYTRLEPGTKIIVLMTRWHEDDLGGRLEQASENGSGDRFHVVRFPAIAEEHDVLGRQPGEALWPERHPIEKLERTRRVVGSYLWSGMYQQRPSPEEGSILRRGWWRWYDRMPEPLQWDEQLASWDMAFKDADDSSYVVGQVWGRIGADKYLIDQVRDHMDFPTTIRAVRQLAAAYPDARLKLVEDKANGPAVVQTLQGQVPGIIAQGVKGSKESRARAVSADVEAGNVYLPVPELAPWVHDFVEECAAFPNATHDDQVDAFTQALLRMGVAREVDWQGPYVDERLAGRR